MTAGSLSGSAAVLIVAVAPNLPVFVLGWLVVGASSACTSYTPAFAALTRWCGERQVRAITTLTLATGFASIVFAPLAALLVLLYLAAVWPFRNVTDETADAATAGWRRFLWINQIAGFGVTLLLIWYWLLTA